MLDSPVVNELHYGDNLEVLRDRIPDESVDLVYLDPPFNSNRNYNLLFKQQKGQDSPAQIMAFEDTWTWSKFEYDRFREDPRNAPLHKLVASLFDILGTSEMMAYVVMMAPRLLELHRKLKRTGSLYLHCDPTGSHYLKLVLDCVFDARNFQNEVIWKRTSAHGDAKQGMRRLGKVHDVVLFYAKSSEHTWNQMFVDHSDEYVASHYSRTDESSGKRYRKGDLTAAKPGGDTQYEWRVKRPYSGPWEADLDDEYLQPVDGWDYKGVPPYKGRYWAYSKENMVGFAKDGRLIHTSSGMPEYKRYIDDNPGSIMGDVWDDIPPINSQAKERRGYPTQKPLALLERIISESSNPGDVILDPFAGCGTAIVAAERMGRAWVGIDITYLAINEIVNRLMAEKREGHELKYKLVGTPKDAYAAQALFESTSHQNHKPYEQWAVSLVGGQWNDKRGADRGIDGRLGLWDLQSNYREVVIQVKGGNGLSLTAVRDFRGVIERENAVMGLMISQREPTREMTVEAESLGYADWPSQKRYPRYQIRSIADLLERHKPFDIPDSYRVGPQKGVGKAVTVGQDSLLEE